MRFLPIAVLALAAFGAEAVVEVPSEAPMESEFPFSTSPIEYDYSETFYPDAGNCRQYPKDTHAYISWKLNKTFDDNNCETSDDAETGGVNIICSVEVEGWFQASVQYTAIPQTKTKEDNPNGPNNSGSDLIGLPDLEPGSLVLIDTNVSGDLLSFQESLDFETSCMDTIKDALRIIETKRENPEDAPVSTDFPHPSPIDDEESNKSEYPSLGETSLYPVSVYPSLGETSIYPSSYPQGNACPDKHEDVLQTLFDTFGEENCKLTTDRQERDFIYKVMTCEFTNPTWFRGEAGYTWALRDGKNIGAELYIIESAKYGFSSAEWLDWACVDPGNIGPNGTCLETISKLKIIKQKRLNPQDGPQCASQENVIFYGRKGKKQITCDELAGLPYKKRNKRCDKNKRISDACPGVCQVDYDCMCINNDIKFHSGASKGKKKFFTCEKLRNLKDKTKKQKRCSKARYQANCPSICLPECQEMF